MILDTGRRKEGRKETLSCGCRVSPCPSLVCCLCVSQHTLFAYGDAAVSRCCERLTALACPEGVTTADSYAFCAASSRCHVFRVPSPSLSPETSGNWNYGAHRTDVCQLSALSKCLIQWTEHRLQRGRRLPSATAYSRPHTWTWSSTYRGAVQSYCSLTE